MTTHRSESAKVSHSVEGVARHCFSAMPGNVSQGIRGILTTKRKPCAVLEIQTSPAAVLGARNGGAPNRGQKPRSRLFRISVCGRFRAFTDWRAFEPPALPRINFMVWVTPLSARP